MSDDGTSGKTFTQADLDRAAAAGAHREREKWREKYGDYDELKQRAEAADKDKGKIDQVLEKLAQAEKRAAEAEATTLRREVADELGLTAKQAKRLTGTSRDELLADGREMIEDMGIKPRSGKQAPVGRKTESETEVDEVDEQEESEDDETDEQEETPAAKPQPRRPARPRETLRSGATRTQTQPDELDPMKLAALIPRR